MRKKALKFATYGIRALAVVLVLLVVWFIGPMLVIGEFAPLESIWARLSVILLVWAVVLGILAYRHRQHRNAERALEAAVAAEDSAADDSEQLSERMSEALATQRIAFPGRSFL